MGDPGPTRFGHEFTQVGGPEAPSPQYLLSVPSSPIYWPLCVQQLEDGFPIHIRGDVETCDVQDGRGQVNVEDDVGVPGGGRGTRLGHLSGGAHVVPLGRGRLVGWRSPGMEALKMRKLRLCHFLHLCPQCSPLWPNSAGPRPSPTSYLCAPDTRQGLGFTGPTWPLRGCFFCQECPPCSSLFEQMTPPFKSHPNPRSFPWTLL